MAYFATYKPGADQAVQADAYFRSILCDTLASSLEMLRPRHFIFEQPGHPAMKLRAWAESGTKSPRNIVPWIRLVSQLTARMCEPDDDPISHLEALQHCGRESMTGYLEVIGAHAFSGQEDLLLTIGLSGGHTTLLSTPSLIYAQLEDDFFGLAVFGRGSWIIERKDELVLAPPSERWKH